MRVSVLKGFARHAVRPAVLNLFPGRHGRGLPFPDGGHCGSVHDKGCCFCRSARNGYADGPARAICGDG